MPDTRELTNELLKEHGAVLVRRRKHEVWKLPSGQMYTRSTTPSDRYADDNAHRLLCNLLGVNGERGVPGERREKKSKRPQRQVSKAELSSAIEPDWKTKLFAVRRVTKPVYAACFAHEKVMLIRTPLTVFLRKIFG